MLEPRRLLAAGDLDATFGSGGVVTSPFGSTSSSISALALQPDGKIIAAGFTGQAYAIARYNTDGSLDQSFGSGGTVVIDSPGSAHSVALEPDGDIIVVGDRNTGTDDTLVVQLTSHGALDPGFGANGEEILNLGGGGSVAIDAAGTVYVAGDLYGTYNVARLNADGSVDTTFGKNGIASLPAQPFSNGNLHDIALQADGKIVLGGSGGIMIAGPGGVPTAVPDFAVVRFNSDGTPDTAFGTGGVVQTTFRGLDNADAMAIQADGKILLAGESGRPSGAGYDLAMARYNSDGTLDSTFGSGGKVLDSLGSDYTMISDLFVEPGGKIVATGQANDSSALFRFNSDGSLDSSFGNQGVVLDAPGAGAILQQPDDKFVVAGGLFKLERFVGETPPSTSGISDINVQENSPASVISLPNDFQGGSVPASQLAYSITADSNSALFASTSIDPQTGDLTLAYAPNQTGTAQLTVRATDPDGAYVESTFSATVTAIQLTPHQEYVIAVYQDVLKRAPDPGGLAYWAAQLDQGMPVSSVAQAIVHSDEYYAHFVIEPDYLKLLGRAADEAGVTYWTQKLQSGLTDQQLEAAFAASDEFYAQAGEKYDATGDADDTTIADLDHSADWIDAIYTLLLGRTADSSGETHWVDQLNAGMSRSQVAILIANSAENNSQIINGDYQHYLGRPADSAGLGYWLSQFAAGETNEDVIAGFTGSAEYYQKHTSS